MTNDRDEEIEALRDALKGAQIAAGRLMQIARRANRLVEHMNLYSKRVPTDEELGREAGLVESLERALKRAGYGKQEGEDAG